MVKPDDLTNGDTIIVFKSGYVDSVSASFKEVFNLHKIYLKGEAKDRTVMLNRNGALSVVDLSEVAMFYPDPRV